MHATQNTDRLNYTDMGKTKWAMGQILNTLENVYISIAFDPHIPTSTPTSTCDASHVLFWLWTSLNRLQLCKAESLGKFLEVGGNQRSNASKICVSNIISCRASVDFLIRSYISSASKMLWGTFAAFKNTFAAFNNTQHTFASGCIQQGRIAQRTWWSMKSIINVVWPTLTMVDVNYRNLRAFAVPRSNKCSLKKQIKLCSQNSWLSYIVKRWCGIIIDAQTQLVVKIHSNKHR